MAELYPFFDDEWMAHFKPVQVELFSHAREMAADAANMLAALPKREEAKGHSFIQLEHGVIDYHVVLNDTAGYRGAMSIEYGRQPDEDGNGGMEGKYILHRATGLRGH